MAAPHDSAKIIVAQLARPVAFKYRNAIRKLGYYPLKEPLCMHLLLIQTDITGSDPERRRKRLKERRRRAGCRCLISIGHQHKTERRVVEPDRTNRHGDKTE